MKILKACLVLSLVTWGFTSAKGADQQSELQLEPCTIELVDGTKVEGKLAVQFNMPDYLIVYSPRLATVRSFKKDYVYALTVDGKREQFNPKRELTAEDRKLLGRVDWPDEPPATGPKPAYTTENWEKPKRLLVWGDPGSTGRFDEPGNWLVNGETATTLGKIEVWGGPSWHRGRGSASLDMETDLLFPAAASGYQVRGRKGAYIARHITIESGAQFHHGLKGAYGNLWVDENGRIDGGGAAFIRGAKHSFYVNGQPYSGDAPETPEEFSKLMKSAQYFARKWIIRKDHPQASVTMIGTFRSGDETHWVRGVTILEENGVFSIGGRTTQTIQQEAKVVLKSGTVFGKNGNQLYKDDLRLKGALLIGTPEEPITRDVYLGLSIKDPKGTYPKADRAPNWSDFQLKGTGASQFGYGLVLAPAARFSVYTAHPGKTGLVITWHGITDTGSDDGTQPGYFDKLPESERTTNMLFLGDAELNDIYLDWFGEGDIRMLNPEIRKSWKRVRFGKHCIAGEDAIFRKHSFNDKVSEKLAKYKNQLGKTTGFFSGMTLFSQEPGTPQIETPEGCYPKGETVTVRLTNETRDVNIRYTLDGTEPSAESTLYSKPFTLRKDTVVKAAGFRENEKLGNMVEARFQFIDPAEVEKLKPAASVGTSSGLAYRFYKGKWDQMPDFDTMEPEKRGVASSFDFEDINVRGDNFGLLMEGFIDAPESGVYTVYVNTARADTCRVYLDGYLVVDNGMDAYKSHGIAGLPQGPHALRIEFRDGGWGELIRLSLRKIDATETWNVTPDMLSH